MILQLASNSVILVVVLMALCWSNICQLPCCGAEGDKANVGCESEDRSTDSRPVQSAGDSEVLRGYKRGISHRIMRCWYPPKDGRHPVVRFSLNRNGEVSNLGLSVTSGDKASDEAALNAVKHAQPFRAIPKELPAPLEAEFNCQIYGNRNSRQKLPGLTLRVHQ